MRSPEKKDQTEEVPLKLDVCVGTEIDPGEFTGVASERIEGSKQDHSERQPANELADPIGKCVNPVAESVQWVQSVLPRKVCYPVGGVAVDNDIGWFGCGKRIGACWCHFCECGRPPALRVPREMPNAVAVALFRILFSIIG